MRSTEAKRGDRRRLHRELKDRKPACCLYLLNFNDSFFGLNRTKLYHLWVSPASCLPALPPHMELPLQIQPQSVRSMFWWTCWIPVWDGRRWLGFLVTSERRFLLRLMVKLLTVELFVLRSFRRNMDEDGSLKMSITKKSFTSDSFPPGNILLFFTLLHTWIFLTWFHN